MLARPVRWSSAILLLALASCKSDAPVAVNGELSVGQSLNVSGAQEIKLLSGVSAGDYTVVLTNTNLAAGTKEAYSLTASGVVAPSADLLVADGASMARLPAEEGTADNPVLDRSFEARLRLRERTDLTPRFAAAKAWFASTRAEVSAASTTNSAGRLSVPAERQGIAIPASAKVGDTVTVNVNGNETCSNPIYHKARVAAIGTHSIILDDTANPKPGFTDADFQRYAARFDTLVYPLDVATFGDPTDIDGNGRIALIFTVEVNKQTPANSNQYIGGFTYSRDLFPLVTNARAYECPASNEGEIFYLLTPDPLGTINGNRRTAGFVDSNTVAVIAHEFQHLINSSRRLYVNNAPAFEQKWLDEGLAHMAEELLFYHEAGLSPRSNLKTSDIQASSRRASAFNLDMISGGNVSRYRSYLLSPSGHSPYAKDDSLPTRGAAWNLLRYLVDQTSTSDGNAFFRLANGPDTGMTNLKKVFPVDIPAAIRDWNVSHAVDDVASVDTPLQQPSWNWHSLYATLYGAYPLTVTTLANGAPFTGTVVAGGAAYYRMAVSAGSTATVSLGGAGNNLKLVIVRTK